MTVGERHYGYLREEADRLYPKVLNELKAIIAQDYAQQRQSSVNLFTDASAS